MGKRELLGVSRLLVPKVDVVRNRGAPAQVRRAGADDAGEAAEEQLLVVLPLPPGQLLDCLPDCLTRNVRDLTLNRLLPGHPLGLVRRDGVPAGLGRVDREDVGDDLLPVGRVHVELDGVQVDVVRRADQLLPWQLKLLVALVLDVQLDQTFGVCLGGDGLAVEEAVEVDEGADVGPVAVHESALAEASVKCLDGDCVSQLDSRCRPGWLDGGDRLWDEVDAVVPRVERHPLLLDEVRADDHLRP